MGFAHDRKEVKTHGEAGRLVGENLSGKVVSVIDDVITTGSSIEHACGLIEKTGGTIKNIVIGFDRQERAPNSPFSASQLLTRSTGTPVIASATLTDLIEVLTDLPDSHEQKHILPAILEYQKQYGIKC